MEQARSQVKVEQSPTRCPYCHADLEEKDLEAAVVCQRCLSRHHSDCWVGGCASCKTTKALAPTSEVASSGDANATYERTKRFVNRAYGLSLLLLIPAAMIASASSPDVELLIQATLVTVLVASGIAVLFLNGVDAIVRKSRDPSTEWLAVFVAFLGVFTGSFASFAYYLRWGREPLPPPRPATRPTVADASRMKGESP
ncbi:MAG: hypothetical protein ACAI25_20825 [Planctomycetota bacterium]